MTHYCQLLATFDDLYLLDSIIVCVGSIYCTSVISQQLTLMCVHNVLKINFLMSEYFVAFCQTVLSADDPTCCTIS